MREKVQTHERLGVAASQEMQRAARVIARENLLLRLMLVRRGVRPDEIQAFLRSSAEEDGRVPYEIANASVLTSPSPSESTPLLQPQPYTAISAALAPPAPVRCPRKSTPVAQVAEESSRGEDPIQTCNEQRTSSCPDGGNMYVDDERNEARDVLPSVSDCFCPPSPRAPQTAQCPAVATTETSCITAAEIIAELYEHRDAAKALVALGCSGSNDCLVKNVKVFQLIDDAL